VRAVAGDVVAGAVAGDGDALGLVAAGLVLLDGLEGGRVGVFEEADQVVVVDVGVAVEAEAEGDEEVLPGHAAGEDGVQPAAGGGDPVVRADVRGGGRDGGAAGGEVDVPDAAVGAGDLEPDDHGDVPVEVVAQAAEVGEVGFEAVEQVR